MNRRGFLVGSMLAGVGAIAAKYLPASLVEEKSITPPPGKTWVAAPHTGEFFVGDVVRIPGKFNPRTETNTAIVTATDGEHISLMSFEPGKTIIPGQMIRVASTFQV